MADFNNVLIICRDLKSVRRLSPFKPQTQNRYILTSDDPRVHEAAKKYSWIDEVCWIEQMESFYNVANDVIRLTETVNGWLKTLADDRHGFPGELLFFTRHVEGGMTTQRIQDLLLLVRSYQFLFDTYKITNVIVISQPGMNWEDDVLIETARSRNIDIQIIARYSLGVLIKNVWSFFKVYGIAAYYTVNVLRINLCNSFKSKNNKAVDKEIVFQVCSSAYKHVENIVPLMKALKQKGYNPVALCWHSNERYTKEPGAAQVRKEGLQAEELEKWCSFSDIWRSISGTFWTWRNAKERRREFLSCQTLNYRSVPLGSLLWPSIRYFIITQLGQSYRLRQALKKYFKKHVPLAIKLWGATALREGYLAWKSLDLKSRPLIFYYAVGAYIDWPYDEANSPVDILFVAGEYHKRMVVKTGIVPSANLEISGHARYEGLSDFKKKYNRTQSRLHLGIPTTFSMYILFDPNVILRGFMSQQEQAATLKTLLGFAGRHSSLALLVKPHPSRKAGILEDMINSREDLKNVFLINNKMLPYHALNAADMLITKFSTLGIEAMLFNRPVICCILDGERRFKIYEEGADYVDSIGKLESLLLRLVTDDDFRQRWHEERIRRQKGVLEEYFCKMKESPAVYQADILDSYLKKRLYKKMVRYEHD